jgi:Ras-related protein Rab-7A
VGAAFYRNAECCVLCFDLTDPKTFETIDTWRTEFLSQLNPKDPDNFPFVVIGNKADKESERKVPESKIKQYCASKNILSYFETSAKDNLNVEKAFEEVGRLAFKRDQKDEEM